MDQQFDPTKLFDRLVEYIDKARPLSVQDPVTKETFLFNVRNQQWERMKKLQEDKTPSLNRTLSNAEALFEVVVEEARRHGNTSGDMMTVIFDAAGGLFFVDDKVRENFDTWRFQREFSRQYNAFGHALKNMDEKSCDHSDLLKVMARLKFCIIDFGTVFNAMRRVRIDKKVTVDSQPQFENGKAGTEVALKFNIEGKDGGTGNVRFPAEFAIEIPIVSMSTRKYQMTVDVDVWLDDRALRFALRCPELPAVKEQAILDEIADFREKAKAALPQLLIVTNL